MTARTTKQAAEHTPDSYAMVCQKSAEAWALSYSRNGALKWQAEWAANRARKAWEQT